MQPHVILVTIEAYLQDDLDHVRAGPAVPRRLGVDPGHPLGRQAECQHLPLPAELRRRFGVWRTGLKHIVFTSLR